MEQADLPAAGATVAVVSSAGAHPDVAAVTAVDGSFRLSRLPAGPLVLAARHNAGTGAAETEVVAGRSVTVNIQLS